MSVEEQGSHAVHLDPHRPEMARQRSNSLPIGLAMMNAEEAGIIFSAAERATARRRRIVSVYDNPWIESSSGSSDASPPPTTIPSKPSPLRMIPQTPNWSYETDQYMDEDFKALPPVPALDASDLSTQPSPSSVTSPRMFLNSLPLSPRRQVPSRTLKNYADGLFMFTQNRLNSAVPQLQEARSESVPSIQVEEAQTLSEIIEEGRPTLQSHFSEWSVQSRDSDTGTLPASWRTSAPPSDFDFGLMSPDSFFGEVAQTTPQFGCSEGRSGGSGSTYASSGTYEPPSSFPSSTPVSQVSTKQTMDEEFSYFANYRQYFGNDRSSTVTQILDERPESLLIKLSPMEIQSPCTPTRVPFARQRADTAIRDPVKVSTGATSEPRSNTSPSTPFERMQVADVAVRVPQWLIGAIG
jgi:hypothetical protein